MTRPEEIMMVPGMGGRAEEPLDRLWLTFQKGDMWRYLVWLSKS